MRKRGIMSRVKIITDSNSGLLQKEGEELGVFVIPMPFTINDEEYFEEISISQEQFYEFLAQNADVTTSQPSRDYLETLWNDLLKEYDELVYIPMTSGLSATCENAKTYAEAFGEKVQVVDNLRISVTLKQSVFEAVELAKQGKTAKEIKEFLESTKEKASIYIMVDTMKYLKKGGRVTPAAAALGAMLKLKPILSSRGQSFEKYAVVMTLAQAKKKMMAQIKKELETEFKEEYEAGKMILYVAHTKNLKEATKFKDEVLKDVSQNSQYDF